MPELPEVETTCRGISPHILAMKITGVIVRNRRLRWPVPLGLSKKLTGQTIRKIDRRAKYILLYADTGCLILHLGMSGSLRITNTNTPAEKHDHVDIVFSNDKVLRFRDPRRFGSIHWTKSDPYQHKLLTKLGPEPLSDTFNGHYLHECASGRTLAIKNFIMDSRIVVGVGNIYANESLFVSGILPRSKTGKLSLARCEKLAAAIKHILQQAIGKGGTTLRDFSSGEGKPGYFQQALQVYGRSGGACFQCDSVIKQIRLGQRSTFYCNNCQK